MRIHCSSCGQALLFPDEKLPDVPRLRFRCPQCKEENTVERNVPDQDDFLAVPPLTDVPPAIHPEEGSRGADFPIPPATPPGPEIPPGIEPEVFPPGAQAAFVHLRDPAWRKAAEEFLTAQGYHSSTALSPGEAVGRLRLNNYGLIIVEDDEPGRMILAEIATWSGLKRRECNVVLAGCGTASLDPQAGFTAGVNVWLNLDDGARAGNLLRQALEGYQLYYQPLTLAKARQSSSCA